MPINPRDVALLRSILDQLGTGISTSDSASVTKLEAVRALLAGTLTVRDLAPVTQTATLGALNAENKLAVTQGHNSFSMYISGTWSGTATMEVSFDGGTNFLSLAMTRADTATTAAVSITGTYNTPYSGAIPPGATHLRVRTSAYTSGSVSCVLCTAAANGQPVFGSPSIAAGSARIGLVAAAPVWYDDTAVALAGAATFTGTSRDATGAVAGPGNGTTSYAKEVNASAVSDVDGTLHLEISRDNSTWRRIRSVATSAVGTNKVAELSYKPTTRYWRLVYVNGAGPQSFFHLNSIAMAA